MEYHISKADSGEVILIEVYADITSKLQRKFAREAIGKAVEMKINNFLVDASKVKSLASDTDKYLLAYKDMERFGHTKDSKVAVLVDRGDRSHDFIETVFMNAGFTCLLFHDKNKAMDWLTTNPPD